MASLWKIAISQAKADYSDIGLETVNILVAYCIRAESLGGERLPLGTVAGKRVITANPPPETMLD